MTPTAPTSPPPSPRAPALHVPALSRILVWNNRRREKVATVAPSNSEVSQASASPSTAPKTQSEPSSPPKRVKPHHIECTSGSELKTHARLVDCQPECRKCDAIMLHDTFTCLNGVDTARLLMLSRRSVFEKVELLGGNAIIDERWSCTICKHHTRRGDVYKVSIIYEGTPARCSLADPQKPVAVTEANGVPGLMTIVSRQ